MRDLRCPNCGDDPILCRCGGSVFGRSLEPKERPGPIELLRAMGRDVPPRVTTSDRTVAREDALGALREWERDLQWQLAEVQRRIAALEAGE